MTETKELVYYIVSTSTWNWGRGPTLKEALQEARALNPKGKLKRGIKVDAGKNIQTEKDVLTNKRIESFTPYYNITGYKEGDHLLPFVNNYGTFVYYGKMEKIEGFDFI
jgi:hypothetical protein